MTSIWDYSATPTSNTGNPPGGFGTGQNPSNVRVVIQDLMGEITEAVHSTAAGGTSDALTVTLTNVPAALTDGMQILVRATAANATTTPTLNLNSLGAKTITKLGGTALSIGDIAGNLHELILRYNLANTRWELLNPAPGRGTWTPAISFGGATTGITYSSQVGDYTRIDRIVICHYKIVLTSKGSATGSAALTGLPFTVNSTGPNFSYGGPVLNYTGFAGITSQPMVQIDNNATSGTFVQAGTNAFSALTDANLTNASVIEGHVTFYI